MRLLKIHIIFCTLRGAKKGISSWTNNGQTTKISALSSGNVGKSEFLTGKDVLPEKNLQEKAATISNLIYNSTSFYSYSDDKKLKPFF